MTATLITQIQNKIGFITLNNPDKSNAITTDLRDTLITTYHCFDKNPTVNMIVLTGNGKNFCTGADLNNMEKMKTVSYEDNLKDAQALAELFYTIYCCEKPTICFAHGKTMGGGLGLLAASDFAISTADATFSFPEVKIGLMPAVISPYILRRIGNQPSKYWMLTAETFDAETALKINLIDRVDENATALAESLLQNSQHAMIATKKWLKKSKPIFTDQVNRAAIQLANIRMPSTQP